jgi:hypothetical protein
MPHTRNIQNFLLAAPPGDLVMSYGILVAIELALKSGGYQAGKGGHDIPSMLEKAKQHLAAHGHPILVAQITAFQAQLIRGLARVSCTDVVGNTISVPPHNYPYLRYARLFGDWAGIQETPDAEISNLLHTCQHVLFFLRSNSTNFGVPL